MTLLVKNVQILGGARSFPDPVDVFVSGDKISAIGNFPNKKADVTVDGQGAYLSPGFIDVNTDSDHYLTLFDHPGQEDFLKQGVTTIFGGACGSSLAPLLYGSLESCQKWGDTDRVNVNWHTMAEFLRTLDRRPLAVNFGTLVGHATIRRALVGDNLRELTKNEMNVFANTLRIALVEGGFGVSFGLGYVHGRSTPYAELKTLGNIVKEFGGVLGVHLRKNAEGIMLATEEAIRLAKDTGAKTLINHFAPVEGSEKEYEDALAAVESLTPDTDLDVDLYPCTASLLPIYVFLPAWTQTGGVDTMLANVKNEWLAERIKKEMPELREDRFRIAWAPKNEFLVGKSLAEIKAMYGMNDARDALLRLMVTMELKGGVLYENLSGPMIKKALASKRSFVASNAPSFAPAPTRGVRGKQMKSERSTSTFTKFLALVEEEHLMPLEDAIRKITLLPARKFGLADRGEIKEGNIADLTGFKGHEIKFTIVGGKVVVRDGEFQGVFPGKALRRSAPRATDHG
jgi:N-acyl-D-amino-acid deacylase